MTMIFTSSRFDPFIYRACCFLWIQFFCPCPRQAASQSHIPFGSLFSFQGTMKRSFTYSHWQRSNAPPKRENISEWKNLFTHLDKGCRNAHPFSGFLSKFSRKIYLFTCSYWEVPNYRVFMKNFYPTKSPFTYSHWEQLNAHPESQKNFYPFTYLELRGQNATCFSEKRQKNLPANIGGHTFDTKNIISLLKYSERIHIGWIICQRVL